MTNTVTLADVIDEMNSGRQFDIEFVTADRQRGTGGQLKAYSGAIISYAVVKAPVKAKGEAKVKKVVNPQHGHNSTVNIYIPSEEKKDRFK